MAGAGYKLFNTGDVLTAAQVNTYLQEQTVMVFANATARTTALSGVLAEGMITYLKDTDAVEKYDGASWVSIAGASSPLTTKGDLYTYSTTNARLPVGNNGETVHADSSQTTGLRYNPPVGSLANPVINGGFDIWQRGTTISSAANVYSADRWLIYRSGANLTTSRVATGDTTNLPNIQYAAQLQRTASSTNLDSVYFLNMLETVNSIPFAGKTVTLSFYARRGANYSPTSAAFDASIKTGTGTDQSWISGYTGEATPVFGTSTLTTTWQRFAYTGTIASTATEMSILFSYTPTGTAGANDWVQVTGVQIDVGTYTASTAPTFRRSGGTLAGELAACQRYYYRFVPNGVNTSWIGSGFAYGTGTFLCSVRLPVTMRVNPTSIETSGTASHYRMLVGSTVATASGVPTLDTSNWDNTVLAVSTSGLTVGQGGILGFNSTASGYIGFVAEL